MSGAMIVKSADTGARHAPHLRHTPAPHLPAPTSCRRLRIKAVGSLFYCSRLDAGESTSFPAPYLISTGASCTPNKGSFRWFAIIKMAHWGTMPPPPTGALSNSPIPLIRGNTARPNLPAHHAPTPSPCPLAHPEGDFGLFSVVRHK